MNNNIVTDINKLDANFKKMVFDLILINGKNNILPFKIIETIRTKDRQEYLFNVAHTTKTMHSKHLEGKAIDIAIIKEKKLNWDIEHDDIVKECYIYYAQKAKEIGKKFNIKITAGAVDWGWDYGHIQMD